MRDRPTAKEEHEKRIECEVRAFVDEPEFLKLAAFFGANAEFPGEDEQVTTYFDCPQDLRIQFNGSYAKVWLKKGAMHDAGREEIELRVPREDYATLERLFAALGYGTKIVWYRTRRSYRWDGVEVALDSTRGYGRILELEKMAAPGDEAATVAELRKRLAQLGVAETPKAEFDARFAYYKEHWRELVGAENVTA